jgi:hypothetical protein
MSAIATAPTAPNVPEQKVAQPTEHQAVKKAEVARKAPGCGKTICVVITPENTELIRKYARCRGTLGEQEVSQKAQIAAAKAANSVLTEIFAKDAAFQEFLKKGD